MKFLLCFLLFCGSAAAMDFEQWCSEISSRSPYAIQDFILSSPDGGEVQSAFEKSKMYASPFQSPVTDIRHVLKDKVKTSSGEQPFVAKMSKNTGFCVIGFKHTAKENSQALLSIQRGEYYTVYLNGEKLDRLPTGIMIHENSSSPFVKLKKGENRVVLLAVKNKMRSTGIIFTEVTPEKIAAFKKKLLSFETVTAENKRNFFHTLYHINRDKNNRLQSVGVKRVMQQFDPDKKDNDLISVLREGLTPDVVMNIHKDIPAEKMAKALFYIDNWNIRNRLFKLALSGRGDYIAKVFEAIEKIEGVKLGTGYTSNLYSMGELLISCGDYENANKLFSKFKSSTAKKEEHRSKNIEMMIIESSNPGKVKPRFISNPETELLKREIDALLTEKPEKEAFSRLFKLIRNGSDRLFQDGNGKYSLKSYLIAQLKSKNEYRTGFSSYINGRYQKDIEKSILDTGLSRIEKITREVEGLADFPQARNFLMEEYFNRGELRKSLVNAVLLLDSEKYAASAAACTILCEEWLKVPQSSRVKIPQKMLRVEVIIGGARTTLAALVKKYRKEVIPAAPGKLATQFELAEVESSALNSYPDTRYKTTMKLPRQPVETSLDSGLWISSSPVSVKAYDSKGTPLWEKTKLLKGSAREVSSPRLFGGRFISGSFYNLEYTRGKFLDLTARDKKGNTIWNSQSISDYDLWEPASLPYSKFNTSVVLLLEKQRTAAPVVALGFIDLKTGRIRKSVPISRIRDPYQVGREEDISQVVRFHDRFVEDDDSIYLFTGSGQTIKVNALHENISWIRGYDFRLAGRRDDSALSWKRAAASSPSFIAVSGSVVVNFDASRMGWFGLNSNDGTIAWTNFLDTPNYIHSRDSEKIIFSFKREMKSDRLVAIAPQTGEVLWNRNLYGAQITGEGCTVGSKAVIPVAGGIAEFDTSTGEMIKISKMKDTPLKIRYQNGNWLLYSRRNAYVYANTGELHRDIEDRFSGIKVKEVGEYKGDLKSRHLEAVIDFPFTSIRHNSPLLSYPVSKAGYYLIRNQSNIALYREGRYDGKTYIPPKVIWNNRYENFSIEGDHLLVRYPDRIEVINVLNRNVFAYSKPSSLSEVQSGRNRINSVRMQGNDVYILGDDSLLRVFDLKSRRLKQEYGHSGDEFIVFDKYILSFNKSSSSKEKTGLYEINGSELKLIKTFKERSSYVSKVKMNSKAIGWMNGSTLYLYNKQKQEIKSFKTSRTRNWKLLQNSVVLEPNSIIDLNSWQVKRVTDTVLLNQGAVILEGQTLKFVGEKGVVTLEKHSKDHHHGNDDLVKLKELNARAVIKGGELILSGKNAENIYSVKDGRMLSRKIWNSGWSSENFFLTGNSKVILKKGRAYVMSHNGVSLPVSQLVKNEEKTSEQDWQRIPVSDWVNIQPGNPLSASYRLQENADTILLEVKLSKAEKIKNGVAVSYNSTWSSEYVYAVNEEGRQGLMSFVESPKRENMIHRFDKNGNEFFEIKIVKSDLMKSGFRGRIQFEVYTVNNGEKAGFYRVGGAYAPGASELISHGPHETESITETRYNELEELYTKADCFIADAESLSAFIKERRFKKGFNDNIKFLESLLKKHVKNISSINILAALMVEKVESSRKNNVLTDAQLLEAESHCRNLSRSYGMSKDWIDTALTFLDIDFTKIDDSSKHPKQIVLHGHRGIYLDLTGTLQMDSASGRALMPLGFFKDEYTVNLRRVEFRYLSSYTAPLGKIKLLKDGKFSDLINEKGDPASALVESSWKNEHYKIFDYSGKDKKDSWTMKENHSLHLKEIKLPVLKTTYNWSETSLLQNLKLNPVTEYIATRMLRKWMTLRKVGEDKFADVCIDILSHGSGSYNLVFGVVQIYREKTQDLKKLQSLLRSAKVPMNLRRRVFLNLANMEAWQQLGPFANEEKGGPAVIKPLPHQNLKAETVYKDTAEKEFKFGEFKDSKAENSTFFYKRSYEATSEGKAYLHFVRSSSSGFGAISVWVNGRSVYEGILKERDYNQQALPLELRKGKNTVLIRYDFSRFKQMKVKLGDLYGAPVSYLK